MLRVAHSQAETDKDIDAGASLFMAFCGRLLQAAEVYEYMVRAQEEKPNEQRPKPADELP
jgi:hypothetical protein